MKITNNYVWEKDLSLNDIVLKQHKEIERLKEELEYTIPIVEHNKTITKHLKEIERLKSRLEEYQEYVEINHKEIERLNNKLKDIKSQLDYLETYSSKEDVFEDMKRRLDRIDKIIGSDKE